MSFLFSNASLIPEAPAPDNTDAIATDGASGTYSEATVTNLVSSIDPTINNLGYARCHDIGHAGYGRLIPVLLFPGFTGNGLAEFPDSTARRIASYVDKETGRAPLVIKIRSRGRGGLGSIDHARDTQDVLDILDDAIKAVGSSVYGTSAICVGYSTGCLDAMLFACRVPDRCLAHVNFFPNYDLGMDARDSYYPIVNPTNRTTVAASVTPNGDTRMTPGDSLDQYAARNAIDAVARMMATAPDNALHGWIIGSSDEPEPLPTIDRLKDALLAVPGARAKTHVHITKTGDANRVVHADGNTGAASIFAERFFYPYLLRNVTEWTMPKFSPPGDLRILGWMKTRLFEIWLGGNAKPKSEAGVGGRDHVAELKYNDHSLQFLLKPVTSTNGYAQVIRDADDRDVAFTAGVECNINLNRVRVLSDVTDIGIEHSFRASADVTNSSGVTAWKDRFSSLTFTASANKPALATDAQGKSTIRFAAVSSQKLVLNSLLVDPLKDFTIFLTVNKTDSAIGSFLSLAHHASYARYVFGFTSNTESVSYFKDNGTWAIANENGLGGHVFDINNKHVIALMRKNGFMYESIDGSAWSKSNVTTDVFTKTGTLTTSLGADWADGVPDYWHYLTGDIYQIDTKQKATSESDVFAYVALMKTLWFNQ